MKSGHESKRFIFITGRPKKSQKKDMRDTEALQFSMSCHIVMKMMGGRPGVGTTKQNSFMFHEMAGENAVVSLPSLHPVQQSFGDVHLLRTAHLDPGLFIGQPAHSPAQKASLPYFRYYITISVSHKAIPIILNI
jgi:hypothetical protein